MAEYQYRIVTPEGKEKKGNIQAKNLEQATMQLKSADNIVLSVEDANLLSRDIKFTFGQLVKPRDLSIFCRQFVSIVGAGVSVVKALNMLEQQTENKHLKAAVGKVKDSVLKGESLATAMKKHNRIFPSMLCNMVEAGETSGNLEIAFERMAIQFEKDTKLKEAVKKAMIYPVTILCAMIVVVIAMMVIVIPRFTSMFEDMGTGLPAITKIVVAISDFITSKWLILIIAVVGIGILYKAYASSESGKCIIGRIKLKIPVFGEIQTKSACARLGRTLSTLFAAGVPLMEALDITAKSMENVQFERALLEAKEQVSRGVPLSRPLKMCGLFPPMVVHMISIGEETGNLEEMLETIANYYEEDVEITTQKLTALLEPLIIIIMAILVGAVVMAVLAPMLKMYQDLDAL